MRNFTNGVFFDDVAENNEQSKADYVRVSVNLRRDRHTALLETAARQRMTNVELMDSVLDWFLALPWKQRRIILTR